MGFVRISPFDPFVTNCMSKSLCDAFSSVVETLFKELFLAANDSCLNFLSDRERFSLVGWMELTRDVLDIISEDLLDELFSILSTRWFKANSD